MLVVITGFPQSQMNYESSIKITVTYNRLVNYLTSHRQIFSSTFSYTTESHSEKENIN